jgi:hypothetical protein
MSVMDEERLKEIEHYHKFGESIGKDWEAELLSEVRRLQGNLSKLTDHLQKMVANELYDSELFTVMSEIGYPAKCFYCRGTGVNVAKEKMCSGCYGSGTL